MNVITNAPNPSAAAAATESRAAGNAAGDGPQLRWRAELERAQWQARQRYEPARLPARAAPADAQALGRAPAAPASAATAAGLRAPAIASTPTALRAGAAAGVQRPNALPASAASAGGAEPWAMPIATSAARAAPIARAHAARLAPAALPFELPDWPARSTQACLQGKRLYVVLRDAAIDASDGPRLRERLRAQCEACGLELAELLINGVPVEPVAPIESTNP